MGACGSSEAGGGGDVETEQKKRSQAIDRKLEEDSKKLRRECKILLLGTLQHGLRQTMTNGDQAQANQANRRL